MRYVSIDIETTGLDPSRHQILQIGAIIEDTFKTLSYEESPKLEINLIYDELVGNPYALQLNAGIIKNMCDFTSNRLPLTPLEQTLAEARAHKRAAIRAQDFDRAAALREVERRAVTELATGNYRRIFVQPEEAASSLADWLCSHGFGTATAKPFITAAGKNFGSFDLQFLKRLPGWDQELRVSNRIMDPAMLFWKPMEDSTLPDLKTCLKRAGIEREISHIALEDAWDVIQSIRAATTASHD